MEFKLTFPLPSAVQAALVAASCSMPGLVGSDRKKILAVALGQLPERELHWEVEVAPEVRRALKGAIPALVASGYRWWYCLEDRQCGPSRTYCQSVTLAAPSVQLDGWEPAESRPQEWDRSSGELWDPFSPLNPRTGFDRR